MKFSCNGTSKILGWWLYTCKKKSRKRQTDYVYVVKKSTGFFCAACFSSDLSSKPWRVLLHSNMESRTSSLVITKCQKRCIMLDTFVMVITLSLLLSLSSSTSYSVMWSVGPFFSIKFSDSIVPCELFNKNVIIINTTNVIECHCNIMYNLCDKCWHLFELLMSISLSLSHFSCITVQALWKQFMIIRVPNVFPAALNI